MEADQAVEHAVLDQPNVDELRLKNGGYEFIFTHPEACLSTKQGVALFQSDVYKRCILAVAFSRHCQYYCFTDTLLGLSS